MEKWALYDKNRNYLNKIVNRDTELGENEFHLSVHAWIKKNDKFLIFQRHENKRIYPNFYEPIAGGVNGNDSSIDTVIREVKEESNIDVSEKQIIKKFTVINEQCKYPEICDVYIFDVDFKMENVKIEQGKNKNPQLLTKEEIIQLLNDNKLLPLIIYGDKIKDF